MNEKSSMQTKSVTLSGADADLLRSGQAQGFALGVRHAVDTLHGAVRAWREDAVRIAPEKSDEVDQFVASFDAIFSALRDQAMTRDSEGRASLARAIETGAGQPRQAAGLRSRASAAMMQVAKRLEKGRS